MPGIVMFNSSKKSVFVILLFFLLISLYYFELVIVSILTLSQCSINSARLRMVCVISGISCEVKACSKFRISSSCCVSVSSVQQDTKAALNRSLWMKFNRNVYAPNKVQKATYSFKDKVKVTRSLNLVSFERVSLVEYTCPIWSLYL